VERLPALIGFKCSSASALLHFFILDDALAVANHRRTSLDDLKQDVVFAQRQKSNLPLSGRLEETLTCTRLCLVVVEDLGMDAAWPAGRYSFDTDAFVFLRDEPGTESQETQLQEDAHLYIGGLVCVITRKEALEVAFCLGSIDPSAECDRAYMISEMLSIIDERALREHVDGKGLHSSREEAEKAAALHVSAQQHSQETLVSHVCVLNRVYYLWYRKSAYRYTVLCERICVCVCVMERVDNSSGSHSKLGVLVL
jgi:hypothetical protein